MNDEEKKLKDDTLVEGGENGGNADNGADAGGGDPTPQPTPKEARQAQRGEKKAAREQNRETRQAQREEHKEYVKENGTAIGNELRALRKGLKEEWQGDMNAIKGRRSGDPAAKTTEESPEAPAPATTQTQTTETPAQTQTPVTTQTQTTATENAEPTEVTQPKEEFSPTQTTEGTAVEKTDGQDVDGATGVVSQETGNGAANPPTQPNNNGQDAYTRRGQYDGGGNITDADGDSEWNSHQGMTTGNPDAVQTGGASSAGDTVENEQNPPENEQNPPENENSAEEDDTSTTTDGDDGNKGGGSHYSKTSTTEVTWSNPYTFDNPRTYNEEEDENLKGVRDYYKQMEENAWREPDPNNPNDRGGFLYWWNNTYIPEEERYNKERDRRDAENAFWRSIGELGQSVANFAGVSGMFGGRNAYGRGAYSSMQNFDLTAPKLTEKFKADRDKRRERMVALKEKLNELNQKYGELMATKPLKEAEAIAKSKKEIDDWNTTREKWAFEAMENYKKRQFTAEEGAKDRQSKEKIAGITAQGKKKTEKPETYVTITIGRNKDGSGGKGKFIVRQKPLDDTMKVQAGYLADCIARELGVKDYAQYLQVVKNAEGEDAYKKLLGMGGNSSIGNMDKQDALSSIKRLDDYYLAARLGDITGVDKDFSTELLNWAYRNFEYYEEFGDWLQNYLWTNGYIITNGDEGGQGNGDDTEGDEEEDLTLGGRNSDI